MKLTTRLMHVHNATREFVFSSLGIFLTPISADTVASLGMGLGIMKLIPPQWISLFMLIYSDRHALNAATNHCPKQSAVFKIKVCVCTFWCSKQDD